MSNSRQPNFLRVTNGTEHLFEEGEHEQDDEDHEDHELEVHVKVPLKPTFYDGVLISMACAYDPLYKAEKPHDAVVLRLAMSMMMSCFAYCLQVAVLLLFFITTVETKEDPYEPAQLDPKLSVLESILNAIPPRALNSTNLLEKQTLELCSADKTFPGSRQLVIVIWLLRTAQEFEDCYNRFNTCIRSPQAHGNDEALVAVHDDPEHGKVHEVLAMTGVLKFCGICFVAAPQLMVACVVTWVGVKFLALTNDMGSLLFKAMSLQFIIQLDELVFNSLAPKSFKKLIATSKIHVRGSDLCPIHCEGWLHSFAWLVFILVVGVFLYELPWHPELRFRHICDNYFKLFPLTDKTCATCGFNWFNVSEFGLKRLF